MFVEFVHVHIFFVEFWSVHIMFVELVHRVFVVFIYMIKCLLNLCTHT